MKKINVSLLQNPYQIVIEQGYEKLGKLLLKLKLPSDCVLITNTKVYRLYGKQFEEILKKYSLNVTTYKVADTEKSKSLQQAGILYEKIAKACPASKPFIIGFGGGVVGDLAGFIASTYKRGIPFIQVPTSLLAQVDASIGGKTAVDLPCAKNMVGTFYQPKLVYINPLVLKTLSQRDFITGLAEVIKYGVIMNKPLFFFLEKMTVSVMKKDIGTLEHILHQCAKNKAYVVKNDEKETLGLRMILNFGHTIGHAIEAASEFSKAYTHGEAVALGMIAAGWISTELGYCTDSTVEKIRDIIKQYKLPCKLKNITWKQVENHMLHDKKFSKGKNRFILVNAIGEVSIVENLSTSVIKNAVMKLLHQ